jgi:hypothetical protein
MTRYERWSLGVSMVGVIAVVLSLGSIFVQTQQLNKTLESNAAQTLTGQLLDLDKVFIENADLRKYFFEGEDIQKDDEENDEVVAIADYYLDFFYSFLAQTRYLPELQTNSPSWRAWATYIRDTFASSPIMCKRLNEVQGWYTREYIRFVISLDACEHQSLKLDERS